MRASRLAHGALVRILSQTDPCCNIILPMPRYARVVPDRAGDRALDYVIPEALASSLAPGSRVRVPLRARIVLATVIEVLDAPAVKSPRAIHEVIGGGPMIRPRLLEMARWISDYYCCPLETAMACVLPQVVRQAKISSRRLNFAKLVRKFSEEEITAVARRAPRQADALRALQEAGDSRPVTELAESAGVSESVFRALQRNGWVAIESGDVARDPFSGETFLATSDLVLNSEQGLALQAIKETIEAPDLPLLLFGVTGSGKTEIYLQAIRHAINLGRTALVLVPEISLTPQTVERFKARFSGSQREVAVLHSRLSAGERHDEWHKIHAGAARIVIGARSAVFAPIDRLGIIIVDEEHEGSYKQEEAPRYHARDIAVLRAQREACAVVLGSATPSMESWHNAKTGKYRLLQLRQRVDDRRMPLIRVLDMRKTPRSSGGEAICAPVLLDGIEKRLADGEQTILFLNRRGFSTTMLCQACGHVCKCPDCSVALTYHRDAAQLACHICGHHERAPRACPACKHPAIRHSGVGTQKVEDTVKRIFPRARVARMDSDAMTRKNAYHRTLQAFKEGAIDILVGTQMIAKGLHFPNVTLVGIINADLSLHVPDFRAGERTFQLLTQVAGRAGRGEREGEVLVQTFTPFSPSIQFARHHDFDGFVEQELEFRERFGFPPFSRMILIAVRARLRERAEFTTQTLVRRLKEAAPESASVGETAPAPLEKAHGYYRFQTTLRGPSARPLARAIQQTLAVLPLPEDVFVAVDVDPVNLL
jgi:primosomal protein N' (replication factor Y) (superfamily II helicase)